METDKSPDKPVIYIIDDTPDYQFLVQQVFGRFLPQYSITLFSSGEALLDQLNDNPERPSLILLDLHMPGLSGQQTLIRLKQNPAWRLIPVVIVTSSSSSDEIQESYEAGANSCLAKPVGLKAMRHLLTLICSYWVDTNRPVAA